ncbi:hypothetical protein [Microlunatus soli]|nr:hypothetical protein [Microlunatus soli]
MSQARVWNPPARRAVRWTLWLAAGITFGILAGFAAGLSQPRREPGVGGFGDAGRRDDRAKDPRR